VTTQAYVFKDASSVLSADPLYLTRSLSRDARRLSILTDRQFTTTQRSSASGQSWKLRTTSFQPTWNRDLLRLRSAISKVLTL